MEKFDLVQAWTDNVAYSHSKSEGTRVQYEYALATFCDFIGKTPQQILDEYENMRDRDFRRKYAQYLRALISKRVKEGYAPGTIKTYVAIVRSFFKYNDLPLGHVPLGRAKVTYHNRDITREEVQQILAISRPRDRAFYCIIAQSGLRPITLCNLKLKNIEPEFSKGITPCKIEVPQEIAKGEFGAYFTFMGEESVKYLKAYLSTRPNVGLDDYLFTSHGANKPITPNTYSVIFRITIEKLKEKGIMNYEQKQEGKPRTVRLYNLRKFFRKYANQAGFEFVQFWMGHIVKEGQDDHYRPKDAEFHRQLYAEKAMPFLRLETSTPSETEQTILELRRESEDKDRRIKDLEGKVSAIETLKQQVAKLRDEEERIAEFLWAFQGREHLFYDAFEKALQEKITEARIEEYEEMRNKVLSQCRNCKKYTPHRYESLDREKETMILVCDTCGAKKNVPILHKRENLRDG